tara:strand:+ start:144 stop:356 length:213 start_codon:yes stop_codon:yes gene_type:complete
MLIRRKSPISGEINTLDLPVTPEQIKVWKGGMVIQRAMPDLNASEREFVMTGITESEWDDMFAFDDEEYA